MISADYDRDGQLFVLIAQEGPQVLATFDPSTPGIVEEVGEVMWEDEPQLTQALTVWGKEALPATGPAEIVPIGLGTALLMLAGAAFVATGRIQRRAE